MKFHRKTLVDFFGMWLPLALTAILAIYSGYKAYYFFQFGYIKGGNLEAQVSLKMMRGEMLFYLLMTVILIYAIWMLVFWSLQTKENKKLIERVDWTVERLAQIETKASTPNLEPGVKWPWGTHHTDALGHLEAAANRFWGSLYDPSDPTTAPTNEMVAEWLRNERSVSKEKAYAIASILRADGLKTGPRR